MDSLPANKLLSMNLLIKKCLLSGQRSQTISSLKVDRSVLAPGTYTFYIDTIQKTTRPGRHQPPLVFQSFKPNDKLCIINCLKEYISGTDLLRENLEGTAQQLIFSYAYSHKPVNSQTIARYVKPFLGMCGIDIIIFTALSTRSASISSANNMGLSIKDIKKAAGWSWDSTFRKCCNLPVLNISLDVYFFMVKICFIEKKIYVISKFRILKAQKALKG